MDGACYFLNSCLTSTEQRGSRRKGIDGEPGSLWNGCAFFNPLADFRCELLVVEWRL